ncbi:hypothetical protein LTR78_009687 [Recurvomyces mirabilis]|uniref:Uncharacterized protein n=1 Tax=Recurvomyces mirabilis TaxID=574656 RepID=A0AAE0WFB2_9PEZI|nr:hypothetical protein LTR78_009687 [Recurvomyces mirabilis]KAK5150271.1 hypothetical protein LTS14_010247 [Recurvomyces mirabilis]
MAPPGKLLFVNFDTPGKADDVAQRKAVRAHATAYSHRVAPRKGLRAAKYKQLPKEGAQGSASDAASTSAEKLPTPPKTPSPAQPQPTQQILDLQHPETIRQHSKRTSQDLAISRLLSPDSAARIPTLLSSSGRRRASDTRPAKRVKVTKLRKQQIAKQQISNTHIKREEELERLVELFRLPDIHIIGATGKDPFDTYPVPYEPWYGPLLDRWYHRLALGPALLKCTTQEIHDYINWVRRFEFSEPAVYYTSILLATGTPIATGTMELSKALPVRGMAVQAMNDALNDPDRATTNAMISAVGKIALHEHLYGDRVAANAVHRPAQQRMIALRGGIAALDLPRITIQFMVWSDTFMAAESRTPRYFTDLPAKMGVPSYTKMEAAEVAIRANPKRFSHPSFA